MAKRQIPNRTNSALVWDLSFFDFGAYLESGDCDLGFSVSINPPLIQ
jgi:hypothetical protein